jgi:glucokinase
MNENIVTGIEIGGSHITAALVDLRSHQMNRNSFTRHHVDAKGDVGKVIDDWAAAILTCKNGDASCSNKIGIAMPGPFDYERGICLIRGLDKYESLYNQNVKALLACRLGVNEADIFMMNDASCFLKGEVFGGAARECNHVIGITLGTGLGSATFRDGKIYDGDLYCTAYRGSTTEDYLSTRWFTRRYRELTGQELKNVKELSERIQSDVNAQQLFTEFGNNLGEVLATYISKHNASIVVIGGNITNAWELFIHETKRVLADHSIEVPLVKAMLGEEAALVGAASLCGDR